MDMSVKFHCDLNSNFRASDEMVRAFIYDDYSIEPHTHDFYEMNIVMEGIGTHIINNHSISVQRGHIFVIPPGYVHSYVNTEGLKVYHILLKAEFLFQHQQEIQQSDGYHFLMEIEPFLRHHSVQQLFLRLSPEQMMTVIPELYSIDEKQGILYPQSYVYKNLSVLRLILLFSHWLLQQIQQKQKRISHDKEFGIINALKYIHKYYNQHITIDALCRQAYMSRSTFLRTFCAVCDCTPMQYVQMYRKQRAIELLRTGALKKTEIAHQCGFYDLSHMEKAISASFQP